MYLFERQKYIKEKRRIFHPLLHSPNGCHSHSWCGIKPEGRSFCWVLHVSSGAQALGWPILPCFPMCVSRELDHKWSSQFSNWCRYEMLALQTSDFLYAPWHQPLLAFLYHQLLFHKVLLENIHFILYCELATCCFYLYWEEMTCDQPLQV